MRDPYCNLDSFFLLVCFHLFWNAQLLDTGIPIARDWVVTTLGFSATLVSCTIKLVQCIQFTSRLIFLLVCFHLYHVNVTWKVQFLGTGALIARGWCDHFDILSHSWSCGKDNIHNNILVSCEPELSSRLSMSCHINSWLQLPTHLGRLPHSLICTLTHLSLTYGND